MDYYWACNRTGTLDVSDVLLLIFPNLHLTWMVLRSWKTDSELNEKQRTTTFHPLEMYTFRNYLAYALYAPLYIAGPIVTFNDFLWQVRVIKLLVLA